MRAPHGGQAAPPTAGDDLQILQQLAELDQLTIEQRAHRWRACIGGEAPRRHRRYRVTRLAYRSQAWASGGLSTEARTLLMETYQRHGPVTRTSGAPPGPSILLGTALLRAWRGTVYRVTVCRNGYEYAGKLYPSLTAIAREITGTRCSGPAFFRLKEGQP